METQMTPLDMEPQLSQSMPDAASEVPSLWGCGVEDLRRKGAARKIKGCWHMHKMDLIDALRAAGEPG